MRSIFGIIAFILATAAGPTANAAIIAFECDVRAHRILGKNRLVDQDRLRLTLTTDRVGVVVDWSVTFHDEPQSIAITQAVKGRAACIPLYGLARCVLGGRGKTVALLTFPGFDDQKFWITAGRDVTIDERIELLAIWDPEGPSKHHSSGICRRLR